MDEHKQLLLAACLTGAVLLLNSDLASRSYFFRGAESVRHISFDEGTPLARRLRASDEVVYVDSGQRFAPLQLPQVSTSDYLRKLVQRSGFVWIVRLDSIVGRLTPQGDWIESDVTGTILETLKSPSSPIAWGAPSIQFGDDGGTVSVDGRLIVGQPRKWVRPLVLGASYVVFGFDSHGGISINSLGAFELRGGVLVNRNLEAQYPSIPFDELKTVLRQFQQ